MYSDKELLSLINQLPPQSMDKVQQLIKNVVENDLSNASLLQRSILSRKYLGPHTRYVIAETDFGLMAVDPEDSGVGSDLRNLGSYEHHVYSLLDQLTTSETRLLVLGAHIGSHVIPIAKKVKSVVAIEANPDTFKLLMINIRLNETTNCTAINCVVAERSGKIPFILNTVNSGGSKRKPLVFDEMYYYDKPEEEMLDCFRLDEIILEEEKFDVALMDLEGSEYFALKGMERTLDHIDILLMEFIPHHLKNVAGVQPKDFTDLLSVFNFLVIPTLKKTVQKNEIMEALQYMFDNNLGDDSLVFSKKNLLSLSLGT